MMTRGTGLVRTVLGDITPDQLGVTMAHEHIVCSISDEQTIRPDEVAADLQRYRACGGSTIVELTNTGMGQDVVALRRLAEDTGVRIVCGTGFYLDRYYPHWVQNAGIDELEQFMVHEIEDGVAGTSIRAGVIGEIGTSRESIFASEERTLRAAARAAIRTGAPLSTHTSFGQFALEQLDIIAQEGLSLGRVSVGHLDLVPDAGYHTAVAERDAFVQYDTFGKNQYMADSRRVACLAEMVRRGYEEQILLANDISRVSYLNVKGGWGYCHVLDAIVPMLREQGVSDHAIRRMTVDNPARFLSFA